MELLGDGQGSGSQSGDTALDAIIIEFRAHRPKREKSLEETAAAAEPGTKYQNFHVSFCTTSKICGMMIEIKS